MEKHLYVCDECKKEIEQNDRYATNIDKTSGWIKFKGDLEYDYHHRIYNGELDFCSKECFFKFISSAMEIHNA